MPSNELTILRFHGPAAGDFPSVSPKDLVAICDALAATYSTVALTQKHSAKLTWTFAVPPRRGCLEIVLAYAADLVANNGSARSDLASAAAIGAPVAQLLYQAVFGGRGLLDLFVRGENSPPKEPGALTQSLKVSVSRSGLESQTVTASLRKLVETCMATGCDKVEIVVPDEPAVVIFSAAERKTSSALIRVAALKPEGQQVQQVTSSGPHIRGTLNGKPVTVFLGRINSGREFVAVIWASQQPVPHDQEFKQVQGRFVGTSTLSQLQLEKALPSKFSEAQGVVVVTGAASYS